MEFVFGFLSLLLSVGMLIGIPYMVYEDWSRAKRELKQHFEGDGTLGMLYIGRGLLIACVIFMTLCAFNNSIWHIDYWTTEGLWKK